MPLRGFGGGGVPQNPADWDRYFRGVPVVPDPDSVGEDELQDTGVTEPKLDDDSVSTRTIQPNAVTNAELRDSAACSLIGRSTNTVGDPADITLADNELLGRRAGVVGGTTLVDADIPASIARDTEVAAAISAHEAASDPHPTYTTAAELATAISNHEAAANPHPVYLTQAEGDALYQPLAAVLSMLHSGTGTPEGNVVATVGHIFLRTDGGAGTTLYVKESGSGNTGWIAK